MTVPQNSFTYRMGAAFPGDVNRSHPASIEPVLNDKTLPVLKPGMAAMINSAKTGVRQAGTADTVASALYGIAVRAFPMQDPGSAGVFGAVDEGVSSLPKDDVIDVCRDGYIMVQLPVGATCGKGDPVWVWIAVSGSGHVQGQFEVVSATTSTMSVLNATYNGPPDANGFAEVIIRNSP
jgi:hypothetical protein